MSHSPDNRWYLAYGSDISSRSLLKQGIVPLASHVVSIPDAKLLFNVHFLPFWEPVLANLVVQPSNETSGEPKMKLHRVSERMSSAMGVAYLLTSEDYRKYVALGSRGTSYEEIIVQCYPLSKGLANHAVARCSMEAGEIGCNTSIRIVAHTLVSRLDWYSCHGKPSKRYIDLMKYGAIEQNFPAEYRRMLEEIQYDEISGFQITALMFLSFWMIPLLITLVFHGIFVKKRNECLVISLLRVPYQATVKAMWIQYEYFWKTPVAGDLQLKSTIESTTTVPSRGLINLLVYFLQHIHFTGRKKKAGVRLTKRRSDD